MTNSPYYDPKLLLLNHDLDKELIQQTLELFEFICGDSDFSVPEDKELKQMFVDALNKYKDSESISIDAIKERIAEQGYLYLTEVFDVTDENLRIMAAYLPMIQILKGTKPGLELIFTILNVGFEIKEWWEDPTNLEILSYILFVELINQPVSDSVIPRLKKFSREYVYPLLTSITLAVTYKLNKTPYIGAVAYSKTALTVWQEFLWLIWSGDGAPENLWTDQKPYQDPITHKSYWQGNKGEELEWDPKTGELTALNMWSSKNDDKDVRVWKFDDPDELPADSDLLEWWIEKICLFGKPEESWSTEDRSVEDPIFTYWSPDSASDVDGTLVRLTIIANPGTALVEINGELTYTATVKKGTNVTYRVYDPSGDYLSQSGVVTPLEDTTIKVDLVQMIAQNTLTLFVLPPDANVEMSTEPITDADTSNDENVVALDDSVEPKAVSKTFRKGTHVYWRVTANGYYEERGEAIMNLDIQKAVTLKKIPYYTFRINPTPANAIVKINAQTTNTVTVKEGSKITWSVSAAGHATQSGEEFLNADKSINVVLTKLPKFTIVPTPSNATVVINGSQRTSIEGSPGTQVIWSVSATGYTTQSGVTTIQNVDSALAVVLVGLNYTVTVTSNIAANISLKTDKNVIYQTANSITVPYGSTVSYVVDPTVDDWSASKSGSVVVTKNENIAVNFTPVKKTETLISQSATNSNKLSLSASLPKMYKNSKTDTWSRGKYLIKGPVVINASVSGSVSGSNSPVLTHTTVSLWYGTNPDGDPTSHKIFGYSPSSVNASSPRSKSGSGSLTLKEGEYLLYATGSTGGTTTASYSPPNPTYTAKVSVTVRAEKVYYE